MFKSKYLKYLVIFVLITIFVLSSFSVSSYASSDVIYRLSNFDVFGSDNDDIPQINVIRIDNVDYTRLLYRKSSNTSEPVRITLFRKISNKLKSGNSYTLSYTVRRGPGTGDISCQLLLSDDPERVDNAVNLGFFNTSGMADGSSQDYSIQLTYPDNFNGKQCYILALFIIDSAYSTVFVSDFVFENNNKSEEKIDGILEWLDRIYYSIVGGNDSLGNSHIGIVQSIQNLNSSLSAKLTNCTNELKSKFEECTTSLNNNLKTQLATFWTNLNKSLNKINSDILSFKSSVEGLFNDFLTFFESKFSILFEKLDTLIKGQPSSKDDFDTSAKDNIDNINKDIEDTESGLPSVDGSDFDKVINTDILSDLSKGFVAVNTVFSIVTEKLGFTSVIVFFLSFGLAIYIIGRRLG